MRILVDGDSLGPAYERLRLAALGLALRGHETLWLEREGAPAAWRGLDPGPGVPLRGAHGPWALARSNAELVLGGGARPGRIAFGAWLSGAQTMVIELAEGDRGRWGFWDRWCWESLPGLAIGGATPGPLDPAWVAESTRRAEWPPGAAPETPDPTHADAERLERWAEHALALRHRRGPRPAVFLDRDGTLVVEKGYLSRPEEVELLPGVVPALRRLRAAGYALIVVSNQAGVGRGIYSLRQAYDTMARLRLLLRVEGVELDAIYFCPHHPDAGCRCRKPGTELLEQAARHQGLALRHSVMIGDKAIDAAAGQAVKGLGVLVRSGYGREEEARAAGAGVMPDQVADGLEEAADWILTHRIARPQE